MSWAPHPRHVAAALIGGVLSGVVPSFGAAAVNESAPLAAAGDLRNKSLEDLLNVEVTSVSRTPQRLGEVPSAIQVLTSEDIRRSGATRLPEVLRLASNLQVAQISSSNWAISARGFNNALANKLLVQRDGRTLYSPLFAGVFWDSQDVLLEDLERIEVVSGPGATLWGANAVNGVINITSKSAADTQGLLLKAAAGTDWRGLGAIRYGGRLADNVQYRVYGEISDHDGLPLANGFEPENDWRIGQGGFRLDWQATGRDDLTVQGDSYDGRMDLAATDDSTFRGSNVLARWTHRLGGDGEWRLQAYYDTVGRSSPGAYRDDLDTIDLDFQHRIGPRGRHDLVWGLGYRWIEDDFQNHAFVLSPAKRSLKQPSAFVQDTVTVVSERLFLTLGAKVGNDDYSGADWQPSVRLSWTPGMRNTYWAAVSRALRTPSRLEQDLWNPTTSPFAVGNAEFDSEKLIAYEAGTRVQSTDTVAVTLATYYNDYDELRSSERLIPTQVLPVMLGNGQQGRSIGAELTVDYRVNADWRLWMGYSHLDLDIQSKSGSVDLTAGAVESRDWDQQVFVRSTLNLPRGFELDAALRYIDAIENQAVPDYTELDLRLGWNLTRSLEMSVVGRNLLHDEHGEFGFVNSRSLIERSVHAQVVMRY